MKFSIVSSMLQVEIIVLILPLQLIVFSEFLGCRYLINYLNFRMESTIFYLYYPDTLQGGLKLLKVHETSRKDQF